MTQDKMLSVFLFSFAEFSFHFSSVVCFTIYKCTLRFLHFFIFIKVFMNRDLSYSGMPEPEGNWGLQPLNFLHMYDVKIETFDPNRK